MDTFELDPATRIDEAITTIARLLEAADVEAPRRSARSLVMHAMALDMAALLSVPERPIGLAAQNLTLMALRRAAHEPLSRITGFREFMGLSFALDPSTLDPRPETEHLVEAVLTHLKLVPMPRILDLGTGSGAILLALLANRPDATGLGIDIAEDACAAARRNAVRLGLDRRAAFRQGDLDDGLTGPFDALVSNPPYIPSGDLPDLDANVRLFDPPGALDGGADGLDFYRRIIAAAHRLLAPGGLLAFEVGFGQAGDVSQLCMAATLPILAIETDFAGIERVVLARNKPPAVER